MFSSIPLILALAAGYGVRFREKQVSNMMMAPMLSQMCLAGTTGMLIHRDINLLFYCLMGMSMILLIDVLVIFKEL